MSTRPSATEPRGPGLSRRGVLVAGLAAGTSLLAACAPASAPATATSSAAPTVAAPPTAPPSPTAPPTVPPTAATTPVPPPPAATPTVAAPAATPAAVPTLPSGVPTPGAEKPLTAQRLIDKPLPDAFFRPMGSVAETRFENLAGRPYGVPNSLFFVRDHVASVVIDPKIWKLSIEGDGIDKPFSLTYDELLKLPATTVTRYVECAGNGRSFFQTFLNKPAQGGQWLLGGWGVTDWTGVRLKDVLDRAGLKKNALQVLPIGLDQPRVRRPIPVSKALEDDTLIVYAMNGNILPIDHGFPARLLVPGWVGVANIKWLGAIAVTTYPNWTDWNTNLYIMIGPNYQPQPPAKGPLVNEQVLKSAIALPWPAKLKAGAQKVTGYAWSPKGKIAKVEVSVDEGKTWAPAKLIDPNVEKAGVRWEFDYSAKAGDKSLMPRATDVTGASQPAIADQTWNQQGYLFGAAVPHPIEVA